MNRQFVYMVSYCCNRGINGLHRINPSRLFYPNDAAAVERPAAAAAAAAPAIDVRLPRPAMSFSRPYETHIIHTEFMLLGRSNDKIVSMDEAGRCILYDAAAHAVRSLPSLQKPDNKFGCSVSLTVGDNLYVIQEYPRCAQCFQALVHCETPGSREEDENCSRWSWHTQPPAPYVNSVAYGYGHRHGGDITAYAAVGDKHIVVSAERHGTYSFYTASSAWSKAGDWALPFHGRAEYVPELGLWFGFSVGDDGVLGAWDLSSAVVKPRRRRWQRPRMPVARVLREGFSVPEEFYSQVVNLGAGNLCVAKMFEKKTSHRACEEGCCFIPTSRNFAMLTGVEVQRRRRGQELDIIKHKSYRYSFGKDSIPSSVF